MTLEGADDICGQSSSWPGCSNPTNGKTQGETLNRL